MQWYVRRFLETPRSIISKLYLEDAYQCFGLEPSRLTPVHEGHPCIPAGTYEMILSASPHLGYVCPEILNVPDRSYIRWHIGNKPLDVLGCVAVGQLRARDWVGNSAIAFHAIMPEIQAAFNQNEKIWVTYTDPTP